MELIMTHHTKNKGFPLSGDHDLLPCFLAIFHVGELSDMVDFEIALFSATVLTLVSIVPL